MVKVRRALWRLTLVLTAAASLSCAYRSEPPHLFYDEAPELPDDQVAILYWDGTTSFSRDVDVSIDGKPQFPLAARLLPGLHRVELVFAKPGVPRGARGYVSYKFDFEASRTYHVDCSWQGGVFFDEAISCWIVDGETQQEVGGKLEDSWE